MRWKKLGKIFDPTDFELPQGCREFAQSPQTLVFDDFVRIYFSTRAVDPLNGKFLSHVAFVDMQKDLRGIIRVSKQSPIPLGKLGCFDEHGIFPFNVLRHRNVVMAYTSGWSRRVAVSVETAIGCAISHDDGLTFQRIGDGPVLASSVHEPFLVVDGFARYYEGQFHMWYIFGTGWKTFRRDTEPDRIYKIGHAVSADGIDWQTEEGRQIIADRLGATESQALPTVIKIGPQYHMWFCYRESSDFRMNRERAYRIGHAHSDDLSDWVRDDSQGALEVTPDGWDSDMLCYPHVFTCDDKTYLLYNGNGFGRYGFGLAVMEGE